MAVQEPEQTLRFKCKVINKKGLHARACTQLEAITEPLQCQVRFRHGKNTAEDASILQLLKLDAPMGSIIEVEITGADRYLAKRAIEALFANEFGESDGD